MQIDLSPSILSSPLKSPASFAVIPADRLGYPIEELRNQERFLQKLPASSRKEFACISGGSQPFMMITDAIGPCLPCRLGTAPLTQGKHKARAGPGWTGSRRSVYTV